MIKCKYFIFFLVFFAVSSFAAKAIINVPIAYMHKQPAGDSSVISNAAFGNEVDVVSQDGDWSLVATPDYYRGWVANKDLVFKSWPKADHIIKTTNLFTAIYVEQDMNSHPPIMVAYGTELPLIEQLDEKWVRVMMPNGDSGYMRRADVAIDPKPMSMFQMIKFSSKLVGLAYVWGGNTPFGFDCSGLVQFLYKQMGINLPRDAGLMAKWPGFIKVSRSQLKPGDVMLMGYDGEISHAGMYLGNGYFINSTSFNSSTVKISKLSLPHWDQIFITARRLKNQRPAPRFQSSIQPIPEDVQQQMQKYTWKDDCPVPLSDLSYIKMTYWGFDNRAHQGVLIIHEKFAPEVVSIFKYLYSQRFPIQRMEPMYKYKGNDEKAMLDNNTSGFNCRHQTDFPKLFSPHSYGGAIDVNPLINPYDNNGKVEPPIAKKYLDRDVPHKGKITKDGIVVKTFSDYGWSWGGNWDKRGIKDYQHFEKNPLTN